MEINFNPENLFKNYYPDEQWFSEQKIAKALEYFLWEFSNLNAPQELLKRINPGWIAYYQAVFAHCKALHILIMGTGFGVLPILAARTGKNVYACDRYPVLAKISQDIIKRNAGEAGERIRFFFKDIKELKPGEDLPEKCDMFIFDDFDHTLLETGFVPVLEYARKHLLTGNAAIVPHQAAISARCVELCIDKSRYDLSPLAGYQWSIGSGPFNPAETRHKWLSDAQAVSSLDFSAPVSARREKISFNITDNGNWNGIVYWHTLFGEPAYTLQYLDPAVVRKGTEEEVTVYQLKTKLRFEPRAGIEKQRTSCLQPWHIDMVNDPVRSAKYQAGITRALAGKGNCRVLDIGSGSGLLSLMAAEANPQSTVYSCEVLQSLTETAAEVARLNGCRERINLIPGDIRNVKLPEKADFVIHEVVASGLLGEGVLHFLAHAKAHLAAPDACFIPHAARVSGMLVENWLGNLMGIGLETVNAYRWHPDYTTFDAAAVAYRPLSAPFAVFDFDFSDPKLEPQHREIQLPVTAGGTANAVVYWFELFFGEDIVLSTSPFEPRTCWQQAVQYVQGIEVQPGMEIPLKLEHDCYKLHFEVLLDKLAPGASISPVPQYDDLWYKRFRAAGEQYQQLLTRAFAVEETFQLWAEAAVKIASDPGQFGVRGRLASRLAESVFIR